MASRSDIKAGRAYVELYLKNSALMKGLQGIRQEMGKWGSSIMSLGKNTMAVGAGIAGAFGAVALAFKYPIQAAGDLMETTSKFFSVFQDATDEMLIFAETYSKTVGRARSDTIASLATMQSFFLGMGLDPDKAADFAKQMASASVDFASFHNLSDEESMQRFISALSGSGEVLSMFGVNIMQAALDQQLLSMGFKKSTAGATEMEKVLARIAIIQRTMGKQGATNDAIRTAGSFSNQMKKLKGEIQNAAEAIGNALLPVVTPLVAMLAKAGQVAAEWAAKNQELIVTIAKVAAIGALIGGAIFSIGAVVFGTGAAIAAIGTVIGGVITTITMIAPLVVAVMTPVGLLVAAIVACGVALAGLAVYWVAFTEEGRRAARAVLAAFAPVVDFFRGLGQGIADALMAGNVELAGEIMMTGLHLVFMEGVNAVIGEIWRIPQAFADMANSLPVWAQQLSGIRPFVVAAMGVAGASQLAQNTGPLQQQLEDLKLVAQWDRELANQQKGGGPGMGGADTYVPGGPANDAIVTAMKSMGSFNPLALEMQNWGGIAPKKDDKQKQMLEKLDAIYQANVGVVPALKMVEDAVKRGYSEYGT